MAGVATAENTFIACILLMVVVLSLLGQALGGCTFNPCDLASSWAVGKLSGRDAALRTAAQAAGAVAGAHAALRWLPHALAQHGQSLVAATRPGIDLAQGAGCEFMLTLLLTFTALASADSTGVLRFGVPLVGTAAALHVGATFSGPVLNPAAALGWTAAHWPGSSHALEHGAIYWGAPLAGAVLATWAHAGMQSSRSAPARRKTD